MKIHYVGIFLAGVTLASVGLALDPQLSVPARLQSPSAEVRQQLREVTAKFLGLRSFVLAEDTLTKESQFVVARTARYDASGQLLQGRVIEPGHIFKLVLREDGCWLIYQNMQNMQNKAQQSQLSLAKCVAE